MRFKENPSHLLESFHWIAILWLIFCLVGSPYTQASKDKPDISWVAFDFPPFEISHGPNKGTGYIDRIRNRFIQELPQYNHESPTLVNQRRFYRLLSSGSYCHSTARHTPAYENLAIQSIPHFTGFADVIITLQSNVEELSKYGIPVPLHKILKDGNLKLGVPSRSMGRVLDETLQKYGTDNNMLRRSSSQVGKELLTLLKKNRIDFTIDYPSAKRAWETSLQTEGLVSLPIKELEELIPIGHITCSNTETGRKIIKDSNKVIYKLLNDPEYVQEYILNAFPKELQDIIQARVESHIRPELEKYRESIVSD